MGFRRKSAVILAGAGIILALAAVPARAAGPTYEICASDNSECYNAWGGGRYIATYSPGSWDNNFVTQFIAGRCQAGSIYTTAGCPLSGTPAGLAIFQVKDLNNGYCAADLNGDPNNAYTEDTGWCNDPNTGYGGSWGTVKIMQGSTACPNASWGAVSVHWSTSWSNLRYESYAGSGNGQQFYENIASGVCMQLING